MIVIPEEIDQELRRAAAAERTGAMRGIGDILSELLGRYELSAPVAVHANAGFANELMAVTGQTVLN